jgi:hypothetical protein
LTCEDFKKTFVECPKNQDHPLSYVRDFAKVKLGIINEVDRFIKLFLESADFAGLLEGKPDGKADSVRFRPSLSPDVAQNGAIGPKRIEAGQTFDPVPSENSDQILSDLGLSDFKDRCDLSQSPSFRVKLTT